MTLVLLPTPASAVTMASASAAFSSTMNTVKSVLSQSIVDNINDIRGFTMGLAALFGLFAMIGALFAFYKHAANPNNQQGGGYGSAVVGMVVGIALLNLWMTLGAMSQTAFGSGGFSWVRDGGGAAGNFGTGRITVLAAAMWLQVIGIFMTMHGLMTYNKLGKSQDASIGKATAHFLGGIFLSNILITTNIISGFTGFKNPFALLGVA